MFAFGNLVLQVPSPRNAGTAPGRAKTFGFAHYRGWTVRSADAIILTRLRLPDEPMPVEAEQDPVPRLSPRSDDNRCGAVRRRAVPELTRETGPPASNAAVN